MHPDAATGQDVGNVLGKGLNGFLDWEGVRHYFPRRSPERTHRNRSGGV